ncbi:MAG TPA: hypothetical protein VNN19_07485 [bacterium]|nr:hypothetical protein [bacterium]
MRAVVLGLLALAVTAAPAAAQPPPMPVRTIAVAEFENISVDSGIIPAAVLSDLLAQLLQRQRAPVRVVAGAAVRAALRARGYTPADLIYPSRAAEVAQAVGAEWLVTGRWTQLRTISRSVPEDPTSPSVRGGDGLAVADVEVRVMEAPGRRRVFEGRFSGRAVGADSGALYLAAYQALQGAAAAIGRL